MKSGRAVTMGTDEKTGTDGLIRGCQLLAALGIWVLLAGTIGVGTLFATRVLAPRWASADNLGALISAEVYLALVIALVAGVGGVRGLLDRLRFRVPTRRDVALGLAAAIVIWVTAGGVYLAMFPSLTRQTRCSMPLPS